MCYVSKWWWELTFGKEWVTFCGFLGSSKCTFCLYTDFFTIDLSFTANATLVIVNTCTILGSLSVLLHLWLLKMCSIKECSCGIMKEGCSLHLPSKGPFEIKQAWWFYGENNSKHSYPPKCCKHACIHKYLWGFLTLFGFINEMFLRWGLDVAYYRLWTVFWNMRLAENIKTVSFMQHCPSCRPNGAIFLVELYGVIM